ncbi:DEDDh family exonuclease [Streptomyces sp. CB01881]|uniref:DEDDh family exonuclease n=1 Tax=Streptomyces sp. CB01881 TaxID=2078691 RepID=UPI000CDBCEA3|nr:DEDDh family exonuclease [Streptomyces sp. CB01881]AUY49309.1 DNA polymerase III subunit epsilon [Streptomyces sp. CB01881]TYC72698.1 DEDDh family exonuclease [Streptomyces sp. CB01881]
MHAIQPETSGEPWTLPVPAQRSAAPAEGFAVVDVETTGLGRSDRVISAGVYQLDTEGEVTDHWYTLVNPERDPGPVWIHGLTDELLTGAPTFPEIADEFAERLRGRVLVAHNALFDWNMISREFSRAGRHAPVDQRLCTMVLSRDLRLPLPNGKLSSLAAYFGVQQRQAHNALDDARVLAEAFRPSLHLARSGGVPLPLQNCVAVTDLGDDEPVSAARSSWTGSSYRQAKKRPPCPYPNPGRWEDGKPLVQGMRVAFTGDTATDRELLEDRAVEAGLHIATSVSRLTSLLVTNEPGSWSGKARKAREVGTPVVGEDAFLQLLREVAPHPGA